MCNVRNVDKELADVRKKLIAASREAKSNEARKALVESETYRKLIEEYRELSKERKKYRTDPTLTGDFVWVFRRR